MNNTSGVVAQMVERMLSMHEATGSMPVYSSRFLIFKMFCGYITQYLPI
jgi:hypothetical protein